MRRIILGLLASLLVASALPSRATELELVPIVPDHVGLTIKKHPSLCWMLAGELPDGVTMMFTLNDSDQIKPILEVQLPSSLLTEKTETCHCVNLKDYGIQLEPNIQYRWLISIASIAQDPESRTEPIVVGGVIERCDFEDCMIILEMPWWGCDMRVVSGLARSGIWYDSISCLCNLIKSNPDDKTFRRQLHSLMRQVGLIPPKMGDE